MMYYLTAQVSILLLFLMIFEKSTELLFEIEFNLFSVVSQIKDLINLPFHLSILVVFSVLIDPIA